MRPQTAITSASGASAIVQLDVYGWPDVVVQVEVVAGTPNYTLDQTISPLDKSPIAWFPCPIAAFVGASANQQGVYPFFPNAIRITQTGAGSLRLIVMQAGTSPA